MMRKVLFIAVVLCMGGLVSAAAKLKWDCNSQCLDGLDSEKEYFHEVKGMEERHEVLAWQAVCLEECLK